MLISTMMYCAVLSNCIVIQRSEPFILVIPAMDSNTRQIVRRADALEDSLAVSSFWVSNRIWGSAAVGGASIVLAKDAGTRRRRYRWGDEGMLR